MSNPIRNSIIGLCVADALGVPVEFMSRSSLDEDPVLDMRSYGTYNQPAGTWSDDTSMTLCLVDSLSNGLDYDDIMTKFTHWFNHGEYTPFGEAFDIGNGTRDALIRFENGTPALECGGVTEYDNGNGSLMRILPIAFYLQSIYGDEFYKLDESFEIIHNVSALTHGHKRSWIACGVYISVAGMLLTGISLDTSIKDGIHNAMKYYRRQEDYSSELSYYKRIEKEDFISTSVDEISSSGYVVYSLEAAIWCLLNTSSYKECVLKAVNLGKDTDTVAAIAGGLAGLYYGYESIPVEWLKTIVKKDYVVDLCLKLSNKHKSLK